MTRDFLVSFHHGHSRKPYPRRKHWTFLVLRRYTGLTPGIVGRRPTMGCAHSKITRVRVLSWPLPLRITLYFLRVTEVLSLNDGSAVIGRAKNRFLRVG